MLQTPQELEVWYILPAIRKELVLAMIRQKLKQKNIAKLLSITGAAVSQYVTNKRASNIKFDEDLKKVIGEAAKRIIKNPTEASKEIIKISRLTKENGVLCKIHRDMDKNISKKCKICTE